MIPVNAQDFEFKAAILDMDGVITQTARVHARAWKEIFDEYLKRRERRTGQSQEEFDIERDYRQYVDGKPRYDGVRSFLQSRAIHLDYGNPEDEPHKETICGLGNRKNQIFHQILQEDRVEVYQDAVEQIDRWKAEGLKVAVISSSRNCEAVLKAARLLELFDAKVDGNDIRRLGLKGKPAPDAFLYAAEQLGVQPAQALIVEDAISGVQAGRAGRFALVAGIARGREPGELQQAGADLVVQDLRELQRCGGESRAS